MLHTKPYSTTVKPIALLIEDDSEHARWVYAVMNAMGLDVRSASTTSEALEIVQERMPSLILVAWDSTGIDGRIIAACLRAQIPAAAQVPAAILTDHEVDDTQRMALKMQGYRWILQKPTETARSPECGAGGRTNVASIKYHRKSPHSCILEPVPERSVA